MRALRIRPSKKTTVAILQPGAINNLTGGNAGGSSYAEFSYNFDASDKTLKSGSGAKEFLSGLTHTPLAIYHFKREDPVTGAADDRLIAMCDDGKFYESKLGSAAFSVIENLEFSSPPIGVCYNYNGEDCIIFAKSSLGAYIYDGETVTEIDGAPPISSACIHYERLFATADGGKSLWFSDDFDPMNWSVSLTEAGFIDMSGRSGEALKVLSFSDALYVFRSYGITRVTAYGDQTQFSVSDLFLSSGKIMRDSVTYCGDRILFMATDGFYSFNGITATKILSGLDKTLDYGYSGVKGQFYNGKAYFLVRAKYAGAIYDCMLVLNVLSGDCYLEYGMDVKDLCLIGGKEVYALAMLCGDDKTVYRQDDEDEFKSEPLKKLWKSKFCDFSVRRGKKVLRKVSLYTATDITLTVDGGERVAVYSITGGKSVKAVSPNMLADEFSIEIYSDKKDACVSAITLEFEYYK